MFFMLLLTNMTYDTNTTKTKPLRKTRKVSVSSFFISLSRNIIANEEIAVGRMSAERKGHREKRADYKKV